MTPTTKRRKEKFGITTLEDISTLILQSHDLAETLRNIVTLVAKRMGTEVCSLYLLEDDRETLTLRATRGLSRKAVGRVRMKISEGLTGLAIEERKVVSLQEPQTHPRYRYFAATREERFHSFVGIPLFDRRTPIGVMNIQTIEPRNFSTEEISALSTIAFQISSIVVNARLLDSIKQKEAESHRFAQELKKTRQSLQTAGAQPQEPADESSRILRGTVAYPGLVRAPANLLDERLGFADIIDEIDVQPEHEWQRIEDALEKTRIQTIYLEKRMAERLSQDDAAIFHTHLMILEDRGVLQKLRQEVRARHSAPYALKKVIGTYIEAFGKMDDPYLRERGADMEDIGRRILANLVGQEKSHLHLTHPGILVARELLPSDMAALDTEKILGIVTEAGEKNSHAVIMAKSLGIPALVGVKGILRCISPEDALILDANTGTLYVNPTPRIAEEFCRLEEDGQREMHRLEEFRHLPATARDGESFTLRANIGLLGDVAVALRNGAQGVGLYRTEFPYMARGAFPDRQDQYLLYQKIVKGFAGHPVTIRTLDIGGDKALPYFSPPREENPFMGWRSVRVSLDNRDIFRTQIEAILMTSIHGAVKLLFPMISGIEEIRACRQVIEEAKQNLRQAEIPFDASIPVGVMIEVPSAVYLASQLAEEVDFFALGTNDLIQYMLAADRNNPLVAKYYDPLHPAVLQVIYLVAQTARKANIGLCICGEMATDPLHFAVLAGMGVREFSMPAPFIPRIKSFLREFSVQAARDSVEKLLTFSETEQIRTHLTTCMPELASAASRQH